MDFAQFEQFLQNVNMTLHNSYQDHLGTSLVINEDFALEH
jgi:hypothetical protein